MYLYFFVVLFVFVFVYLKHKVQRLARDASGGRLMRCAGVYMDNDVANGDDHDDDLPN